MKTLNYLDVNLAVGENIENVLLYVPIDKRTNIFIISDDIVFSLWKDVFPYHVGRIVIPAGESQKNIISVEHIVRQLIEMGADRNSFLLGIGGGVVCDITGFVASVFMRGVQFGFVPTTLLAQVDASIGGKNAVNTGKYKNMIGVFNHPLFILIDFQFLSSLPLAEVRNGVCEAIKHACIYSRMYFDFIDTNIEQILLLQSDIIEYLVLESVKIKTDIVGIDPFEKSERKKLNFGHTYGHAIETTMNISHGQAVSLGMVIANAIAVRHELLQEDKSEVVKNILKKSGLPIEYAQLDFSVLNAMIVSDKKKKNNTLGFILLHDIGSSSIQHIPIEQIPYFFH